jgi:hypothetical protein
LVRVGEATHVAQNAAPPSAGDAAPKAGAPVPPPLELIGSVTAVLEGGEAKASWKVAGKQGDDGDFEYIAIARVPDQDLASNPAGQNALLVTIKPDVHVIATQVTAIGGAPLAGTKVQPVDPETGIAEGDPVETDGQGKVILTVPENKPYDLKIVDDDNDDAPPPEQVDPHDPEAEDVARVYVRVFDARGAARAGVPYQVEGPHGFSHEGVTDAEGDIELNDVTPGGYKVRMEGDTFKVHSIFQSDLTDDPSPYRVVAGPRPGAAQA